MTQWLDGSMFRLAPIALLALVTGCTHYEFDLVRPPELTRHVGRAADQVIAVQPLEYHLRAYENVLVMRVYNPTDNAIELLGTQCAVVDPSGESHPLREQTIAPQSYIKLLFPPPRPTYYEPGPTFGIGLGTRIGAAGDRRLYDPWFADPYLPPRYMRVYDGGNALYWSWQGQSEVRMTLVYRSTEKNEPFRHEFAFRRVKVK